MSSPLSKPNMMSCSILSNVYLIDPPMFILYPSDKINASSSSEPTL
jgi:hypothetical protein